MKFATLTESLPSNTMHRETDSYSSIENAQIKVMDTVVVNRNSFSESRGSCLSTEKEPECVGNIGSNEVVPEYPSGLRLGVIFSGLCAAICLVVLVSRESESRPHWHHEGFAKSSRH